MMNLRRYLHSAILGWGLAVAVSVSAQPPGQAINNPQNPDLTRQEVANFDQFLDQHPDIDKQLRANPSLINNADFMKDHPALGQYLASHKEVSEEIKENPNNFMHREQRFDRAENRTRNSNPDVTRQEVAGFDQFLDQHPDIDKQLRANPSLINNADFMKDHPALGQYLASHKEVSEELKENPGDFMHREQRFDRDERRASNPNPDVTRKQVASFDQFLDKHPDIDKQLDANPGLMNDQNFINHHKDLRAFLKDHPDVREEMKENPGDFMRREQRFDGAESNMTKPRPMAANPDLSQQQVAAFDDFLDRHKGIDKDLRKDPSLINDPKFVKNHHELQKFLEKNPGVSEELRENPSDFMRQESRFEKTDRDRDRDRSARSGDKDDHKKDRDDHDKHARSDKDDHRNDRDDHDKADKKHHEKDNHKVAAKEHESTLEEKERLHTMNPH